MKMETVIVVVIIAFGLCYTECVKLDAQTCKASSVNPITYTITKLTCFYDGPGIYLFNDQGQESVERLTFDRLTSESHLRVHTSEKSHLKVIDIENGQCDFVSAPSTVTVTVNGKTCITLELTSIPSNLKTTTERVQTTSETSTVTDSIHEGIHVTLEAALSPSNDGVLSKTFTLTADKSVETTTRSATSISHTIQPSTTVDTTPWIIGTAVSITVLIFVIGIMIWRKLNSIKIKKSSEGNNVTASSKSSSEEVIFQISSNKIIEKVEECEF